MASPSFLGSLVCAVPVSGGTPRTPGAALQWSDNGQALVVAGDALHIITPAAGLSLGQDASHPSASTQHGDSTTRAAQRHYTCTVTAPASSEPFDVSVDTLDALGSDWVTAAWSPSGLGARGTCRIAAITSRRAVVLVDAPRDHVRGPWVSGQALDTGADPSAADARRAALCYAVDWSPLCPTRANTAFLAAGCGSGVYLWAVDAHNVFPPTSIALGSRAAAVKWGEWADGRAPLAVHTAEGMRVLYIAADGSVCGPQTSCALDLCYTSALTWRNGTLLFATPGALHAWTPGTGQHDIQRIDTARVAAGVVGDPPVAVFQDWRTAAPGTPASASDQLLDITAPGTHGPASQQLLWALSAFNGMYASLSTADEAASWRYRVGRRLVFALWAPSSVHVDHLVELACSGVYRPAAALRPLLCAAADPTNSTALVRAALFNVSARAEPHGFENLADCALNRRNVELRACNWLATRLGDAAAQDALGNSLRLADLERRVRRAKELLSLGMADTQYVLRLAAVLYLSGNVRHGAQSAELLAAIGDIGDAGAGWTGTELWLGEQCAACGQPIPFSRAPHAKCASGHVFWRCAATMALMTDIDTLTCTGCGQQASRVALVASGEPDECTNCGHLWVAP
ncbi:hypothetical protein MCUN1_002273 [Malassezia cuniculi]|uniref:Transcription factor IIIC putative zinc-finger domain-containing protein n=1 Tax=Malassezia cuniculi TaxID=948313 RepID=A0AAF0EVQ0_9BASI|nr:hypothetical protein MCUN1_002273 [Malassezia cuniculi]